MPKLSLISNVKPIDVAAFILEFQKFAGATFKSPEAYMATSFEYQQHLCFAGTFEPAFLLTVGSLGNINPENNVAFSKAFFEYLGRTLGVPDDRGYISFHDAGRANVGFKSTTMAKLLG
ncbi:Tautomerase/MIF superfamily [Vararia minispora EC-137]|uniref:Tautomerase/MIF superfamily n=1 Tax=Vararia minispora EC-137 TaxID=1314806 RepID=A0ACB8Q8G7_9AGAM|nr:Tautomerase/MIF superfamily [Vararia minispora EC-137]